MIRLDLTTAEREILIEVLDGYLSDLRMEISDTDRKDFRDGLKERKTVVMKAIDSLRGGEPLN